MKEKIVIIGGGGHAKVIISIIKKLNDFDIVGYTELTNKNEILSIPYLGNDNILTDFYKKGISNAVLGLGQIKPSSHRRRLIASICKIGYSFPPVISPNSVINEEVNIGRGTVIMDGVIVNSGVNIGEFSIINTKASIDHDCNIGSFTHIAPGVTLSGEVKIGNDVLIGTGANIIQGISIIENSLISAGSSVQKDINKPGIYRGVPAEFVRSN